MVLPFIASHPMGVGSTFVPTIALSAIILLLQAPPPGSDEGAIFALAGLSNSPEFRKALKEEHDKSRRRVREERAAYHCYGKQGGHHEGSPKADARSIERRPSRASLGDEVRHNGLLTGAPRPSFMLYSVVVARATSSFYRPSSFASAYRTSREPGGYGDGG